MNRLTAALGALVIGAAARFVADLMEQTKPKPKPNPYAHKTISWTGDARDANGFTQKDYAELVVHVCDDGECDECKAEAMRDFALWIKEMNA